MKKKRIVHLISGFAIFSYFKNSIDSIIKNDISSKILITVNGSSKLFGQSKVFNFQFNEAEKIKDYVSKLSAKKNLDICYKSFCHINKSIDKKTGNLYNSYNYALKYCYNNQIDYLNILQNDMQLLWWNNQLINLFDELFEHNNKSFFIHTGFVRKGSNPEFYEITEPHKSIYLKSLKKNKKIYFLNNALGDWGLFNIKRMKKINFSFEKNENFISKYYFKKGYIAIKSPVPIIGVLPWPACARYGSIYGFPIKSDNLLLTSIQNSALKKIVNSQDNLFQEDWIKSNTWWSLEPAMYTDFKLKTYLNILLKNKKIFNDKIFTYTKGKKTSSFIKFFQFYNVRRNFFEFFLSLLYIYILKLYSLIRK